MRDSALFQALGSVLNTAGWEEHDKIFVSKISIRKLTKGLYVENRLPRPSTGNMDIIDEINSSDTWKKISSAMGEIEYQKMWKLSLVFFDLSNNVRVSLNGCLLDNNHSYMYSSQKNGKNTIKLLMGYNPSTVVDRKTYLLKNRSFGSAVIPTDYETVCDLINKQETGVPCSGVLSHINSTKSKLLKKFLKNDFRLVSIKNVIARNNVEKTRQPCTNIDIVVKTLLESYVPRGLIGSKKAFKRMTSNICNCFKTHPQTPVKLATLMKGLPRSNFQRNAFLCKFILFLHNVFINRVVHKLFYITQSLKDKKLLFFKKHIWNKFEKTALQTMIDSDVLVRTAGPYGPHVSKLRIMYKPNGFRPLVISSPLLKKSRFRLSVCNTLLKQIVSQIRPGYGHVLNDLHSQWKNLKRGKLYFVRTDVSDAFQSILHSKLIDIVTARLSLLDPVQTCRTFEFKSGTRKKSVLLFSKVCPHFTNKTLYYETGKKEYTTSYLKAVIIQYIRQNYLSLGGSEVFQKIKGLSQGSYLSSVLCELYLADMDECYFNQFKSKTDVFIRGVDDYLYITSDCDKAKFDLILRNYTKSLKQK